VTCRLGAISALPLSPRYKLLDLVDQSPIEAAYFVGSVGVTLHHQKNGLSSSPPEGDNTAHVGGFAEADWPSALSYVDYD